MEVATKLGRIRAIDKLEFLLERARDKNVLHLGCADWPQTEQALQEHSLLHANLADVSRRLVGIDLNADGVRMLRDAGHNNVYVGDAERTLFETLEEKFEIVIAGEILGEVLNPGLFLQSIASVCNDETQVLFTIANYAQLKRLPYPLIGYEKGYPNHVYMLSRRTLNRMFEQIGFCATEWFVYWHPQGRLRWINWVLRRLPFLSYYADGFCVTSTLTGANK